MDFQIGECNMFKQAEIEIHNIDMIDVITASPSDDIAINGPSDWSNLDLGDE